MLTECAKQQLLDCCRLGIRNQFNEEIEVELPYYFDEFSSVIVHEGTFSSLGLKRFYIKDEEIKTTKYSIPYRGFLVPVMGKDVFVIQCISGDFVILRIIGKTEDVEEIKKCIRKDSEVNLGMTYEDFKEANRRDLELHKRVSTFKAKYNQSPERFDSQGNVITSLDHYDRFEYQVRESNEDIYHIYEGEKEKRRLEQKLIYLEEKQLHYECFIDEDYSNEAVDAITSLFPREIDKYFTKGGKFIHDNIDEISFQTDLTKSQIWKAWKYLDSISVEKEIIEINSIIKEIDEGMDLGKSVIIHDDDRDIPNLFQVKSKSRIVGH